MHKIQILNRELNQIDTNKFFESYVVGDVQKNWSSYAACITGIIIVSSKKITGDYHCAIKVAVKIGNELSEAYGVYKNILTTGRNAFQDFTEEFELLETDEDGAGYLDFTKLNNKICIAKVNTANQVKNIVNVELDGSETEKKIIKFFENNVKDAHSINMANVPSEIKYYCYIPSTTPDNEYLPNFEYHGCIRDVECKEKDNDVNIKIAAYVFNGSYTKVIAKFFNKINSTGKSAFDEFCRSHEIVDDNGKPDINKLKGRLCKVVLCENRKGNKYIDTLFPLEEVYDVHINHYAQLIEMYKKSHRQ